MIIELIHKEFIEYFQYLRTLDDYHHEPLYDGIEDAIVNT